ncbi:putative HTH-type transcriptional repressor ExuR [compost metagenome]
MLLQLLVESLARQGFRTTVWELEGAMDDVTVRALVESPVDGVIFATATEETRVLLDKLATEKPLILVNRSVNSGDFDTVVSDNHAGGRLVARHFLAAGRRQIGLISTRSAASTIREREEGFIQALREAANPVECLRPSRGFDAFTYENGHRAMRELMAASPGVDSVFCTNDIVAIGALDAARSAGRRVPEDLWMVGYDDIPMARWDCIGLSTIRQPLAEMASRAVNRLQERIAEPDLAPETVVLPNDLVVRRTTA